MIQMFYKCILLVMMKILEVYKYLKKIIIIYRYLVNLKKKVLLILMIVVLMI